MSIHTAMKQRLSSLLLLHTSLLDLAERKLGLFFGLTGVFSNCPHIKQIFRDLTQNAAAAKRAQAAP